MNNSGLFGVCFFFNPLFQQWYSGSMKVICMWLADRLDLQLHIYQLKTLIKIVKVNKMYLSYAE